jgi:DNA polymerase III subunit delta'
VTMSQEAILTALRLCAGSPGAAQMLLQDDHWAQRQTLCQATGTALKSGDWLAMLSALNHDRVAERLQWLSSLFLDALKVQQGASLLSNVDSVDLIHQLAQQLRSETLHALLHAVFTCREQLLSVVGVNRELLLTDLLLNVERYLQPGVTLPVSHL